MKEHKNKERFSAENIKNFDNYPLISGIFDMIWSTAFSYICAYKIRDRKNMQPRED